MSREGLTRDRLETLTILYTLLLSAFKKERKWCVKRNKNIPAHPEAMLMAQKLLNELKEDDAPEEYKLLKSKTREIAQKLYNFLKTNDKMNKDYE